MSGAAPARWQAATRWLAVRLDNLGDVLMTTPALRALRALRWPGGSESGSQADAYEAPQARDAAPRSVPRTPRHLTLLTSSAGAALAPHLPEVDAVIACDVPWQKGGAPTGRALPGCAPQRLVEVLAARRFDAAVIFTTYTQSALPAALVCTLAGIPLRLAHVRENPYALLSDWVPEREPAPVMRHEVRRQLDLVGSIGARTGDEGLSFRVRPQDRAALRAVLATLPGCAGTLQPRPLVVIHPGASAPSRRYPPERYAEVARALSAAGCRVHLTGTAAEQDLVRGIAAHAAAGGAVAVDLAGRLGLGVLGALLERADLLIANNSGPVHIAAALGTPVVDLYALTNPQHTPWRVAQRVLSHDVPCKNCYRSICPEGHHACLTGVAAEVVVAAALELLAAGRAHAGDAEPQRCRGVEAA